MGQNLDTIVDVEESNNFSNTNDDDVKDNVSRDDLDVKTSQNSNFSPIIEDSMLVADPRSEQVNYTSREDMVNDDERLNANKSNKNNNDTDKEQLNERVVIS